jgi:hypothetical protein
VFIEAPQTAMDDIIARHELVRDVVVGPLSQQRDRRRVSTGS